MNTFEEMGLRALGLDPIKINDAMVNGLQVLGAVKGQLDRLKRMADNAQVVMNDLNELIKAYEAQQGHIEKLISDVQSQIAAYQANQRRFGGGRTS